MGTLNPSSAKLLPLLFLMVNLIRILLLSVLHRKISFWGCLIKLGSGILSGIGRVFSPILLHERIYHVTASLSTFIVNIFPTGYG
jgi:hypothetical protein